MIKEIVVTPELEAMQKLVPTLIDRANAFEVDTDQQYEKGSQVLGYLKTQATNLEKLRLHFKQPILESGRRIDTFFKTLTAPAKESICIVDEKMSTWWRIKEEKRQKALELAQIAERDRIKAEEERVRIQNDMEKEGIEVEEEDLPPLPPAVVVPETTQASSTSIRKTWSYTIQDADKIPRIYLVQSNKLIMQSIHDGVREIPGLEIFQEISHTKKRK